MFKRLFFFFIIYALLINYWINIKIDDLVCKICTWWQVSGKAIISIFYVLAVFKNYQVKKKHGIGILICYLASSRLMDTMDEMIYQRPMHFSLSLFLSLSLNNNNKSTQNKIKNWCIQYLIRMHLDFMHFF